MVENIAGERESGNVEESEDVEEALGPVKEEGGSGGKDDVSRLEARPLA